MATIISNGESDGSEFRATVGQRDVGWPAKTVDTSGMRTVIDRKSGFAKIGKGGRVSDEFDQIIRGYGLFDVRTVVFLVPLPRGTTISQVTERQKAPKAPGLVHIMPRKCDSRAKCEIRLVP